MQYYEPPKWNRANTVVPLLLFLCAIVSVVGASYTPLPLLLQVVAVGCGVVAILLVSRYSLSSRAYQLTEADSEHLQGCIRVLELRGNQRPKTLCDLSFTEAVDFFAHKKKKDLAAAVGKVKYYRDFRRNLTPAACYDLVLTVQGERAVLVLELDQSFAAEIEKRVTNAKTADSAE